MFAKLSWVDKKKCFQNSIDIPKKALSMINLHICSFLNVGIVTDVLRSPTSSFHFVTMNLFANFLYSDFANFFVHYGVHCAATSLSWTK